ncbi:MAG: T9SS type A sorting domain-containing protein [Bacteroidales bacterium]|nr:T9SS type A sorting domain-containing protein [Bacteroidales bacterium]
MEAILHNQVTTGALENSVGKFLNINLGGLDATSTEISIINHEGTKIHHTRANGFSSLKVSTKHLPKGFYLLQVTSDKGIINKKLIIE